MMQLVVIMKISSLFSVKQKKSILYIKKYFKLNTKGDLDKRFGCILLWLG